MLKKLIFICLMFGFVGETVAQKIDVLDMHEPKWEADYSTAQKLASESNSPILVFFTGSDWCGPCKMLVKDFFKSEKFKNEVAANFVLYEANFPRNSDLVTKQQVKDNGKLKGKYSVSSYPTIVVVTAKGKKLGLMKGYNLIHDTSYHYSFLEAVLSKHKKRLSKKSK